jgi:hypothetical protein
MKRAYIFTLFILFQVSLARAQDEGINTNKYRVWINMLEEPYEVQGTLYKLNDSSLVVSHYKTFTEFIIYNNPTIELQIKNIDQIGIRKKNRVLKGILIGGVSGFAAGSLIGLSRGDDEDLTAEQKAIRGGITLGIPGALVGMLIGSVKIVIPIETNIGSYKTQRNKLQQYSTH